MLWKSNLILYEKVPLSGVLRIYLSRRSLTARMYPDHYSFWGGGIEAGESAEEAMLREMWEELTFRPNEYDYLGLFWTPGAWKSVFIERVEAAQIDELQVLEGQGGTWFTPAEIYAHTMIIEDDKRIIKKLVKRLAHKGLNLSK